MTFGRRVFLLVLAAVAGAYGIFRSRHPIKVFLTGADTVAEPPGGRDVPRPSGKFPVAAVGGRDVKEMTRRAVALIGGFGPLAVDSRTVLVKPNVVGEKSNPSTTSPVVVRAVVELLYEAGAAKVYVGDMSALIRGSTARNMELTGIAAAAREAGAETVYFEDHGWVRVRVGGRYLQEVDVTEWFFK